MFRLGLFATLLGGAFAVDSGAVCAGCIIVVRVIDMGLQQGVAIDPLVDKVCNQIFGKWPPLSKACSSAWAALGPSIIRRLEDNWPESDVCKDISLCPKSSTCRLLPPKNASTEPQFITESSDGKAMYNMLTGIDFPWPWTQVVNHRPAKDLDGDGYSDTDTLRGSDWRGSDCNDLNKNVYPGRKTKVAGAQDHNCNGITEHDEKELCDDSDMRRLIIFGDSASAHFHVPWGLNLTSNAYTVDQVVYMLENELDYPQWSWGTGFDFGSNKTSFPDGNVDSIYMRLVKRNRCNTNFRENLSVNGARSTSVVPDKTNALASNPQDDYPAIVFYAMVGNDVINPHIPEAENAKRQTSPEEFRQKVMGALQTINTRLPNGSHVVLLGLEHGGDIWPNLQERIHPGLSIPNSPVTYREVWDLMNCLGCNPGFGYLDANQSYREHSSQLAKNLSNVLEHIANTENGTFSAFDLTYIENPDHQIVQEHIEAGCDYAQLIEWVGGGHPSQKMHAKTAQKIWETLERIRPDILGKENPNNAEIDRRLARPIVI